MRQHKTCHSRYLRWAIAALVLALLLPWGVTLAQSGEGYGLTTVPAVQGDGVSSGSAYVLTQVETWPVRHAIGAQSYLLAPLSPEEPQANPCVYLPVVLRTW